MSGSASEDPIASIQRDVDLGGVLRQRAGHMKEVALRGDAPLKVRFECHASRLQEVKPIGLRKRERATRAAHLLAQQRIERCAAVLELGDEKVGHTPARSSRETILMAGGRRDDPRRSRHGDSRIHIKEGGVTAQPPSYGTQASWHPPAIAPTPRAPVRPAFHTRSRAQHHQELGHRVLVDKSKCPLIVPNRLATLALRYSYSVCGAIAVESASRFSRRPILTQYG